MNSILVPFRMMLDRLTSDEEGIHHKAGLLREFCGQTKPRKQKTKIRETIVSFFLISSLLTNGGVLTAEDLSIYIYTVFVIQKLSCTCHGAGKGNVGEWRIYLRPRSRVFLLAS